jgi:hypothetical protein
VLASLRINAASVTGVIIANEAGGSSAVSVAAVDQIQTTNRSGPTDLGSVGAAQNQTEQTRRKLEESLNQIVDPLQNQRMNWRVASRSRWIA